MDWMYANCSATAQRGALDWLPKFKAATLPVFHELYSRVKSGEECVEFSIPQGQPTIKKYSTLNLKNWVNLRCGGPEAAVRKLRPVK